MNLATLLQDRRMLKFRDVLSRWERRELSMMEAGELLGPLASHGSGRRNGLPGRTKKLQSDHKKRRRGRSAFPGRPQPKRTTDVLRKPDKSKSY